MENILVCPRCGAAIKPSASTDACSIFLCGYIQYADGTFIESVTCARAQRDLLIEKIMDVMPAMVMWLDSEFSKTSPVGGNFNFELDAEAVAQLYKGAFELEKAVGQITGMMPNSITTMN